jgi:type I restriction enzyme M protein
MGKRRSAKGGQATANGASLGFETKLWEAADILRGSMDAAEYKHVVLGLVFLKYISDAFEERRLALIAGANEGADPEDPDEYRSENVFWVPPEARWQGLQNNAKQADIGARLDAAMDAIERDNQRLKDVLSKDYARPTLDKRRLGELVDLVGTIGLGGAGSRSRDVLGRVYEYFLGQFAKAEGKKAGEYFTPRSVVRILVDIIEPYAGRVFDPCCGSAGMFVQSEAFIEAHGGRRTDISIFGQESNPTTWRLAQMNLAIRGIEANLGGRAADSFHNDLHAGLKADFVLANPPFNDDKWGGQSLREDVRWKYGQPPLRNANFAWVQHFVHHLSPRGIAGFVLANGSMSASQSGEGDIRRNLVEADLVDCIVALPGQLFFGTAIPACLWFLVRDKSGTSTGGGRPLRDRRGETLFIDARKLGSLVDRTHRELSDQEIALVARTYHGWRGQLEAAPYADTPGFCHSANAVEVREQGQVLTPSRYVEVGSLPEDDETYFEQFAQLKSALERHILDAQELDLLIRAGLENLESAVP